MGHSRTMGRSRSMMALGAVLVVAAAGIFAVYAQQRAGAAGGALISVSPASQTVASGGGTVKVEVDVSGASGVAAFAFTIKYNPAVLTYVSATPNGDFLAAGDASPFCPGVIVDEKAGTVTVGCVTSGQHQGASGSGTLGTVTFQPKAAGSSPLVFLEAAVTDSFANTLPSDIAEGIVTVVGPGGDTGGPLAPTPTKNPTLLTPTAPSGAPTPSDVPTLPAGNVAPGSSGSGTGGSGTLGSGVAPRRLPAGSADASAQGGAAGGSASGAPKAGTGPERAAPPRWPPYAAALIGLMGFGMITAGVRARRRGV